MQDIIPPPGGVHKRLGRQSSSDIPQERASMAEDLEQNTLDGTEGAIAQEFGGEIPSTVEVAETNEGSEVPSLTLGELGEAALDGSTEESDEDVTASIPETVLEHDLAEDVAYAEKPFRDGIDKAEEAGKLNPETKDTLEWLASEAAADAMTRYAEARENMSDAEATIREHASKFMVLDQNGIEFFVKHRQAIGSNEEQKTTIAEDATSLLKWVVTGQLEQILADDALSPKEKLDRVGKLELIQRLSVEVLQNINLVNGQDQIERMYSGGSGENSERAVAALWGHVVATIATGYPFAAIESINRIAKLTGQESTEIIDTLLPSISKGVLTHNTAYKSSNDSFLESHGYLWSDSKKRYVKVAA